MKEGFFFLSSKIKKIDNIIKISTIIYLLVLSVSILFMKKRNILEISCAEIFIISLQKELHLGYIYIKETENKSHSISKEENTHPLYTIFIDNILIISLC